jgi:hypothetical protein
LVSALAQIHDYSQHRQKKETDRALECPLLPGNTDPAEFLYKINAVAMGILRNSN